MDELRLLLVKNQNNLDSLRVRTRHCASVLAKAEQDTERQYGPLGDFWDEWLEQLDIIISDLRADLAATALFTHELREYIVSFEKNKKTVTSRAQSKSLKNMLSTSKEALLCQQDMIKITDERLTEHKEFTHKLLLVEAIDSLNED